MPKSRVGSVTFNRAWDGPKGTVFYFDITFEDGGVGQFSTIKREQTKFTIGEEIEYIIKGQNKRGQNQIDIVRDRPDFKKSTYNNPETNKQIAMSVAVGAAIETALALDMKNIGEDDIYTLAQYYYQWIIEGDNDRDKFSLKWNSILNACKYIPINGISTSKGVLESAKEFFRIIETTKVPV